MIGVRRGGEQRQPAGVRGRCRIAVRVGLPNRRDRAPEPPMGLVVPAADRGVRRRQVRHGEQARVLGRSEVTARPTAAGRSGSTSPARARPRSEPCRSGPRSVSSSSASRSTRPRRTRGRSACSASAFGPSVRNRAGLSIRNGLTRATHAFGSFTNAGSTGRHCPGWEPTSEPERAETAVAGPRRDHLQRGCSRRRKCRRPSPSLPGWPPGSSDTGRRAPPAARARCSVAPGTPLWRQRRPSSTSPSPEAPPGRARVGGQSRSRRRRPRRGPSPDGAPTPVGPCPAATINESVDC